jgi:tRNA-2-methylthio-N6-dimethylallyladenosine synthase
VVPYTRGPERSRTVESVLAEAGELARMGYTEIQLLGQNVNSYRDPSIPSSAMGNDFAFLLRRVAAVPGLRRVRFTTSHPRDFVKDIVDAIDENPVLCNHIHLPVQSGSTAVLGRMQRQYTRDEYLRRIEWMQNAKRPIAITTDIIVGFPGETEDDFAQTIDLLDRVQYDALFAFKYSKRPNTPALQFEDHVPEEEKTRRIMHLLEHQRGIQIRRNASYVGRTEDTMVEGWNQATRQWIGRTSQHKPLNFLHPFGEAAGLTGRYLAVRVTRSTPHSLAGEAVLTA